MARVLGFFLVLGGTVLLIVSGVGYLTNGAYDPILTGTAWAKIHVNSLQVAQPAVERYLSPFIWQNIIAPVLLTWLWVVMVVLGLLLMLPALLRNR